LQIYNFDTSFIGVKLAIVHGNGILTKIISIQSAEKNKSKKDK